MAKILRKSSDTYEAQFPKLSIFAGQKSIFRHYCIQNVKDGTQIRVYKINNENVIHFSQKMLRKPQAQFREKLRKLRVRQNDDFLIERIIFASKLIPFACAYISLMP